MLNLQAVKEAIDQLSPEELHEIREHLEKRVIEILTHHPLSPEERIRRLDEAARAIRESFTDTEWEVVEQVMNEAYFELIDEDSFPLL